MVTYVCATGASVLSIAQEVSEGVIVCAESLRNMTAGNIAEHLPPGFDIVALTRGDTDSFMSNLVYLPLPVDRQEFLSTVSVLVNSVSSFTRRKDGENEVIAKAKLILREVNGFSEMQAHKYLQRESMKMGKKIFNSCAGNNQRFYVVHIIYLQIIFEWMILWFLQRCMVAAMTIYTLIAPRNLSKMRKKLQLFYLTAILE